MNAETTPAGSGQGSSNSATTQPINVTVQPGTESAAPAPVATQSTDWTSTLNEDLRGFVQNKGFKDPSMVLDSYRNLEKLMGAPKDRLLKLPEKMDDAAAMNEIFTKLGKPATPGEYQLEVPKENGNPEFTKWAQGTFHELGLTKAQGETLVAKWNELQAGQSKAGMEQLQAKAAQQEVALKREWGAAFDQNIGAAKRAAQVLDIKPEVIDSLERAMGFDGVMKLMHSLGTKVGEDSFVVGGKSSTGFQALTPEAARNEIAAKRSDNEFIKRYTNGDASAREEMNRLHKFAYPDG